MSSLILLKQLLLLTPHPLLPSVLLCTSIFLLLHSLRIRPHLPPSPLKLPLIGNLHQIGPLPHRSLRALSRRHGPLMLLHLGRVPTLVVSSPEMAREVMKTQDPIFAGRPSLTVPNRLLYGCKDVAFAPYGDYWRHARRLSLLHLLSPRKVRSYRRIREEEISFMVDRISRPSSHGSLINLSEVLASFAKDVVGKVSFGSCLRSREGWNEAVDVLIEESNELLGSFHLGDYVPWLSWVSAMTGLNARVERAFSRLDQILSEIVESCKNDQGRENGSEDTFAGVLLSLQREQSAGFHLDKDNIKAILEDMFGAGTDSTVIVLEWCMAELLRHPKVLKKLQSEVRAAAQTKAMITDEDLHEMSYLKAVVKETMRLHPPGPLLVPRESMVNTRIHGFEIPSGTRVIVNSWAIGRDPAVWESPEEFGPERFVGSLVDFRGQDFQLIPFGAGRRVCPGIGFAMAIIELALANIVHRFDWELPHGMEMDDMDMEEAPGITSRKKYNLFVFAKPYIPHSENSLNFV